MTALNSRSNEAGNILIYILGAIFLLGLLVVIVKGSSTPGSSNIDKETLILRVNEVQNYGQELERAIAYIMRNGHSEADIRFAHPDADVNYGVITDTPTRQIFSTTGGGAKYRAPPENIQVTITPWFFSGSNRIDDVGTHEASSASADLIAILPNVTENFCLLVNEKNGITNPLDAPPQDVGSAEITTEFAGTFSVGQPIEDSTNLIFNNKLEGCFEGGGTPPTGSYHYYRVLLAR